MDMLSLCSPPSGTGVSIIVRTEGHRPELLHAALVSLRAQTHRPLDIVVVEDGGRDLAGLIAAAVGVDGARHLPIPKGGRSRAGNAGIAAATMPYLGFLDDDDELLPSHAAVLTAALDRYPEAPAVYGLAREVFTRADGRPAKRPCGRPVVGLTPFSCARLWLGNFLPIQAVLARRSSVLAVGGLDEGLDALEDWDLWLRLAQLGDFVAVEEVTSWFRVAALRRTREARAVAHAAALDTLKARYADLTKEFHFSDLRRLLDIQASEQDERVGARYCVGRLWKRLKYGR